MSGYLGRGPLNTKSPHFDRLDIHGPLNGLYSKAVRCIATREGTNKEVSARVVSVARPSQRALSSDEVAVSQHGQTKSLQVRHAKRS